MGIPVVLRNATKTAKPTTIKPQKPTFKVESRTERNNELKNLLQNGLAGKLKTLRDHHTFSQLATLIESKIHQKKQDQWTRDEFHFIQAYNHLNNKKFTFTEQQYNEGPLTTLANWKSIG